MYELSKVLGFLATPLSLSLILGIVASAAARAGRARLAWRCGAAGVLLLWTASTPVVADAAMSWIIGGYERKPVAELPHADAIVVLGGAVIPPRPPHRPRALLTAASVRVEYAASLYKAGKAPLIVVAAGQPGGPAAGPTEASAIAEMLVARGIPASALRLDHESRNTRENADNALRLLDNGRRVLLVTSAIHMRRALATFASRWSGRGMQIVPAPADSPGTDVNFLTPSAYFPNPDALKFVTLAGQELAGLLVLDIMRVIHR